MGTETGTHDLPLIDHLKLGHHFCFFFETEEEHRSVVSSSLRRWLEHGDKVLYIQHDHSQKTILDYLTGVGINVEPILSKGQLIILDTSTLSDSLGNFPQKNVLAEIKKEADKTQTQGFSALRVSCEMGWALQDKSGTASLIEFEIGLNEILLNDFTQALCQYDLRQFDPVILMDLIVIHPVLIVGTQIYENIDSVPESNSKSQEFSVEHIRRLIKKLSERKDVEDNLRFTRQWVDLVSDFISLMNSKGRFFYVNNAICNILGYTREEMKSLFIQDIIPELSTAAWTEHWAKMLDEGTITIETGYRARDGGIIPVELKVNHLEFNGTGYACAVGRDIGERKRAEQAILDSELHFRQIVENSQAGYFSLDLDGNYVYVNSAWLAMYNYSSPHEVIGNHYSMMYPDFDQAQADHIFEKLIHGDVIPNGEGSRLCKDGSIRYHTFSAQPVYLAGEIVGVEGFLIDITEHKQAEDRLRFLSSHDALTGLYNRAYFEEEMNRLELSRRYPISIVIGDVDGLKWVNDRYGHAAGDEVLRRVGQVLMTSFRNEDVVARIGGDEFAILLPGMDAEKAQKVLDRVHEALAAPLAEDQRPLMSLSLGIATAHKGDVLTSVLKEADERMYRSKSAKPRR
ncbi:MAG TPA: PAS domain S-box protein [Anaerolineaceae bacterium]|nr:PAS domain S-box protein [Anaerolineaceae bacterium]